MKFGSELVFHDMLVQNMTSLAISTMAQFTMENLPQKEKIDKINKINRQISQNVLASHSKRKNEKGL